MSDKTVKSRDTAVLDYQASGSFRPQLVWRIDSNPLFATEALLHGQQPTDHYSQGGA